MNYISNNPYVFDKYVRQRTKQDEKNLRDSQEVRYSVEAVRKGYRNCEKIKTYNYFRIPNGCPIGAKQDGERLSECLEPTGKFILDYDVHGGWQKVWKIFRKHLREWGVLHFEKSARLGAHITCRRMEGLTLDENITLFEKRTGLTFDHACSNIGRCIFLVPNEDVLYETEEYYDTFVSPMPQTIEAEAILRQSEEAEKAKRQWKAEIESNPVHYSGTDAEVLK